MVEVLRWVYRIPFRRAPTLSREPIPFPAYSPRAIRGKALEGEICSLLEKGAIELAPLPSLGYYSRLFVVMKASGSWRPVIDLSLLNLKVLKTSFKMETLQSVMLSVRPGDWMVSLDLKDAYLQVPMHPESRKFLRFVALGKVYQFKVLCFGLSTAPQVFTRVMAPVSAFLHQAGIRIRRYLDDWLIQASSREQVLLALESVLQLCNQLGIVVNWEKSHLVPSQQVEYLGVLFDSVTFRASPAQKSVEASLNWRRVLVLRAAASLCLAGAVRGAGFIDPAHSRGEASDAVSPVLPQSGGMRPPKPISSGGWISLCWSQGSLCQISPQLELWSDASDVGWGTHLGGEPTSGLWSLSERLLSINARELLAVERALLFFAPQVQGSVIGLFADNSTAIAYLRNQGGTRSRTLNSIAQRILRSAESLGVILAPQFILGRHNVMADALSRPNQVLGSEWSLKIEVFQELRKRWPVSIDLFATSLNHRCSLYFSPFHDPSAVATDALLQDWNGWLAYAFPPWALIPAVLKKLRSSSGVLLTLIAPYWPQRPWFPELLDLVVDGPVALPLSRDLLRQPHFHRFHLGVSRLSLHAWRLSSDLPSLRGSPGM